MCIRDRIQVVQTQIVVVLYGEMVFMEIAFQNSCRLCSIRAVSYTHLDVYKRQINGSVPAVMKIPVSTAKNSL